MTKNEPLFYGFPGVRNTMFDRVKQPSFSADINKYSNHLFNSNYTTVESNQIVESEALLAQMIPYNYQDLTNHNIREDLIDVYTSKKQYFSFFICC